MRSLSIALAGTLALVAASCGDRDKAPAPTAREPQPQRRSIEPPAGTVRQLPPYGIDAAGIGPYKLRQRLAAILDQLPSGPRIERYEIPSVLHTSLIRAEDDHVLIGGEPTSTVASSTTAFVAVIDGDVARTESGVHVGTSREELAQKLGPFVDDPERAHDPRLVIPSSMRNARFLLDHDRVAAIVIAGDPPREPTVPAARDASNALACPRPLPPADDDAIGACLGGPSGPGELIEVGRDEVLLRSAAEPDRPASPIKIANVIYAVPLRNPTEGRDELVAVKRDDDAGGRTWSLAVYRIEAGRAKLVAEAPLYTLTAVETRWIGVDLRDVDIYLDLVSRPDSIEVAGLLTARVKDRIRDVVLISPVTVTRRHGKSATGDAGTDPADTPTRTGSAKL